MTRVFFASHFAERSTAEEVRRAFEAAGCRTWVDWIDLATGVRWEWAVEQALGECGLFLFFLSESSATADYLHAACRIAVDRGVPIATVRLGYARPDGSLESLLEMGPTLDGVGKSGADLLRELRVWWPQVLAGNKTGPPRSENPLPLGVSLGDCPGMFCNRCGTENPGFHPLCGHCGGSLVLDVRSPVTHTSCPVCTALNPGDAAFCRVCGSLFEEIATKAPGSEPVRLPTGSDLVGLRLGQWRLTRVLGVGGQGCVYEAVHLYLRTPAALKVMHGAPTFPLHGSFQGETVRRCLRGLGRLLCEQVARILDFGEAEIAGTTRHYLVTELVTGSSVSERVGVLSSPDGSGIGEARGVFGQLCLAIAAAHEVRYFDDCGYELTGVIHGDIKPANLLVTADGGIKLIDFLVLGGRIETVPQDENWTVAYGTLGYMAPEQLREGLVTRATDLYSMGVTLLEMLTGGRATDLATAGGAENLAEFLRQHNPRALPYARVLGRCLAMCPDDRYASVRELMSDLPKGSDDLC